MFIFYSTPCLCQVFPQFILTCQDLAITDIFVLRIVLVLAADGSLKTALCEGISKTEEE